MINSVTVSIFVFVCCRFEMLDAARNRVRVKACYGMMIATIAACLLTVILGKRVSIIRACLFTVILGKNGYKPKVGDLLPPGVTNVCSAV